MYFLQFKICKALSAHTLMKQNKKEIAFWSQLLHDEFALNRTCTELAHQTEIASLE